MMNMMIMMAKEMPEELLLDELEKSLAAYKLALLAEDEELINTTKKGLEMNSVLVSLRFSTEGKSTGDITDRVNQLDDLKELDERLHPKTKKSDN